MVLANRRMSVLWGVCVLLLSMATLAPAASLQEPRRGGDAKTGKPLEAPNADLPMTAKPKAVAFLVNGFTGCCIPKRVKKFLEEQEGVKVYEANWNDLERKRDPGHFTEVDQANYNTDEYFIKQMQDEIAKYPEPTPIILIGHSFGGDSVLQVVKRINGRRIAFLGVLDPVGRGGLRENVTEPVPSSVAYFFNRWQQNPPIPPDPISGMEHVNILPVDSLQSGKLSSHAGENNQKKQNTEKTKKCKTKYRDPFNTIPQLLTHSEVPNDSCVQQKVIKVLEEKILP